ncbi:SecY protein transport family protein [Hibiscus syriacus]|uniref:SecY protein transport family protein n=1 Tax=Hibiscus syriacus TaxID=106335 RepID=A0A6A3CI32_HIBSY|nr:uncharacterized protein LOC120194012 [Hibiscus syriacus]KAE8728446.1 SecY protein transport family protein [Hibiscus syriacus]
MEVAADEDIEVVSEEPISWLPSHVLHEPLSETQKTKDAVKYHYHHHPSKLPTEPFPPNPKSSWRRHDQKQRYWGHWASGVGGMQAFFSHSGNKSTGTGVFLPQTQYNNTFHSTRRPACSPVLLPSRVVQALNLNVYELSLQISPHTDPKNNNTSTRGGEWNSFNNKNGKDVSSKRCVSGNENSSAADIFLPDEWTY